MNESKAKTNGHSPIVADAHGPEYVAGAVDLDALREEMIELGLDPYNPSRQDKIAAIRERARYDAAARQRGRLETAYEWIRLCVQVIGNTITMLVTLVFSYVALPAAVIGFGRAEFLRVEAGIAAFDPDRAELMANVAVLSYMLLLFIQAQMMHNDPARQRAEWSLRLTLSKVFYMLGITRIGRLGSNWEPRYRGQYEMLRSAIAFLAAMIVLLGTAGALQREIAQYTGVPWMNALRDLAQHGDLQTVLNFIGGSLLTVALIAGLHFVINLTYDRYVQIMPAGGADFLSGGSDFSAEQDRAEALYLMLLIQRQRERQNRTLK